MAGAVDRCNCHHGRCGWLSLTPIPQLAVILTLIAPQAVSMCITPLALMLLVSLALWFRSPSMTAEAAPSLSLESPFQLVTALKFGGVFLSLNVVATLAQRWFGQESFYFVSIAGEFLSSASSIAAAATLINRNELSVSTGVTGVILASLTSILVNIPVLRTLSTSHSVQQKATRAFVAIAVIGLVGVSINILAIQLVQDAEDLSSPTR